MQTPIPSLFMRGGTSRGPFFLASDLPSDIATRDRVLLAIMGSPDARQIDGMGGAHPLTSKVGIVSLSSTSGVTLDFLFAQLQPNGSTVDTTPNCGNMLAAVLPFALERGLIAAQGDTTTARVLTLNTGMQCDITVQTPFFGSQRQVSYAGDTRIDGVPGSSAPVSINFLDTAGSVCASLLPTGRVRDRVEVDGVGFAPFSIDVTCIDNGMPLVLFRAADLGYSGYESVAELNADAALKQRLEALRLQCGHLMGLGDVSARNYPKMTLIAPAREGGSICTRSFIPHVCHDAIGVLAAVTVGTACVLAGSVCDGVAQLSADAAGRVSVEHPSGEFCVELGLDPADPQKVLRAALLRTARLIMRGEVMVPAALWQPTNT
ncbi:MULTISPECIES: 4-oxalomesaconate tautomerase [unclassified Undibacterium]|uniref:4-oxalomesaconate tautomerase n=1 Tax=unclassified Undibacterium TaxID=2630295 RepID=UPI002AC9DC67|nr:MULTISPECIES: 4-oxalomesaconate tautomerase [unclassified Undibacterium]MEB0138449.1 4-oxalomesaconate tautomerase [Undibacterium sp. CCC2.1]MEB0171324.1 4-oxalomesaconate tautomerase [Undibacterium sp. CCC1.1]MEB0176439.1 4-oxalomesaconate tautomerase [Undibacterium sp. CCC3.4]MEB0214078.1 4-oxalomesaconate tautomerase [Undibacterium sp. 5I2]WPX43689.1 4-oxalomesaconate tautomerase [Undibacterium sp. CCC3.4]